MLEFLAGTGSVGSVFKDHTWEVISLDRDMPADIRCDTPTWDYRATYPPDHFDFIWASPPCTEYSRAKTIGIRKIDEANSIVSKTREIIDYFQPAHWVMENPQTGLLKNQDCIQGLPYHDVDYCKYGMLYRKRTRLWNNLPDFLPRPLCRRDCAAIRQPDRKDAETAQQGQRATQSGREPNRHRFAELYRVPRELVEHIIESL